MDDRAGCFQDLGYKSPASVFFETELLNLSMIAFIRKSWSFVEVLLILSDITKLKKSIHFVIHELHPPKQRRGRNSRTKYHVSPCRNGGSRLYNHCTDAA